MLRKILFPVSLTISVLLLTAVRVPAMQADGCGGGECKDCHSMTIKEARGLLKGMVEKVSSVKFSEVGGLWEVDVENKGKKFPLYLDFSKQFLINGQVIKIATRENLTRKRLQELNIVDVASIPIDDAVVVGNPNAKTRIIVFDDPECPYCIKLHKEIKKVVKKDSSIAFFIKMFPLKIHPNAYDKAKAIVCEKSLKLLEDSFDGKKLPKPSCKTDILERNMALAYKLKIRSTPTMILPDGRVMPGYKKAEDILKLLK